jgi:methylglutaconyl-CoA hydratase
LISAQPEVTLEHLEDHICAITLQRPSKQNAIGQQLLSELCATLDELANASMDKAPRAVIVRSSVPGIFCAGGDFKEMAGMSADELKIFIRLLRGAVTSLEQLPMPTIAVIAGGAFGGGAAILCRIRGRREDFPKDMMCSDTVYQSSQAARSSR